MGCGESDSAAGVATGPSRPERRIAPLTEISTGRSAFAIACRRMASGPCASGSEPSLASSLRSRRELATRSRVAMSSAIARRRLFRAPPVLWSALS